MASVSKRTWVYKGVESAAWVVRYRGPSGSRHSRQFDLKKEADAYRQKVEREMNDGCHVPASEAITIGAACEMYLRHAEDKLRDKRIGMSRLKTLRNSVGRTIPNRVGHLRFTDLTAPLVEDLYAKIVREDGLHPRTVKQRIIDFGLLDDFAYKRGLVGRRVIPDALRELRGISSNKVRTFTSEEVMRVLSACEEPKVAYDWRRTWYLRRMFVNIAACTGLRFGEIKALSFDNIDPVRRVVKVRHNLTEWDELKPPKTPSGRREVPLPHHVAVMIGEWTELFHTPNDRNLIFRTHENNAISASAFHVHCWRPILNKAGLMDGGPVFRFHSLRHFYASWLIDHGVPVTEVAVLLGHSKFDMTLQTYAHPIVSETRRHEAVDRMTAALLAPRAIPEAARLTQELLSH